MDLDEYRRRFNEDSLPGWEAIDLALRRLYGTPAPMEWGTSFDSRFGGPDPLDGISAYECRDGGIDHLHFITYGYTGLYYDEEAAGGEFSELGFEMTFRLATQLPVKEEPGWVLNLLQNLARYVFKSGKWFDNYHWIPANGPIRADSDTEIVGLAFLNDPALPAIDTPHGRVAFIQAFGLTQQELEDLGTKAASCEEIVERHRQVNPLLVTDLTRRGE